MKENNKTGKLKKNFKSFWNCTINTYSNSMWNWCRGLCLFKKISRYNATYRCR